ncbi:MAG: insulinase family protein [Prevotella sp.]|nr:insulinase family protein [Prevotella sp.]
MKYNTAILPNGLRVIHLPSASAVVYCGYQIAAGTRDEQPGEEGLAHFCEHVTFKGTRRRNALQIINCLEQVGGDLNAFTNKEDTTFYAAIHRDHFRKAVDLLTDIVFDSQYPQQEIDKEIEVVCDEIESYNDSPAELIYDEFESILFQNHPLGHNILGSAEQLRTYTTADALRFTRRHYRPDNAIFFVYGDVDFKQAMRCVELKTKGLTSESAEPVVRAENVKPVACPPNLITRHRDTHQAHVMMGCRAYDINHPHRIALYLLNNLLGGPGMNSRLNLSLRERHGLVYAVESSMVSYSDAGLWAVYFGCDADDVTKCRQLVRRQLDRLMEKALSASQLSSAKQQLKGQIAIACDNRENFALDFGKSYLHHGKEKDLDQLFASIDAVSATELQQVACELFAPEKVTTLVYL